MRGEVWDVSVAVNETVKIGSGRWREGTWLVAGGYAGGEERSRKGGDTV